MIRLGLALALVAACSPATVPSDLTTRLRPQDYPGSLRAPAAAGADFMYRQRVTAQWKDLERGFDAVLQKQGDRMQLIGLTPMNTPAFVITHDPTGLEFENRTKQLLPFPPRFILLDVQRVFFPWPATLDGERIEEDRADGHLVERRFRRADGKPPGVIRIRYEGWEAGANAPRRAVLDNGWFGYRLIIETFEQRRL